MSGTRALLTFTALATTSVCAQEPQVPSSGTQAYEDARLVLRIQARTPEQTLAFYSARGFPQSMLDLIRKRCFVTVGVRNKSTDILRLEPARWKFGSAGAEIPRYDRTWWNRQWQALNAPLPSRSTFRWTLLPESLDLRPDEAEGGNITLPRVAAPFWLEASFDLDADRREEIRVRIEDLRCAPAEGP